MDGECCPNMDGVRPLESIDYSTTILSVSSTRSVEELVGNSQALTCDTAVCTRILIQYRRRIVDGLHSTNYRSVDRYLVNVLNVRLNKGLSFMSLCNFMKDICIIITVNIILFSLEEMSKSLNSSRYKFYCNKNFFVISHYIPYVVFIRNADFFFILQCSYIIKCIWFGHILI